MQKSAAECGFVALQSKMLQSIAGWVRMNDEDWCETMRRLNHGMSAASGRFPIPPRAEQLAKFPFQFAAKVAAEQSWSSIDGHWILTAGWSSNFDIPLANVASRMVCGGLTAIAKCAAILRFIPWWTFWSKFSPCPHGIVNVVFHKSKTAFFHSHTVIQ